MYQAAADLWNRIAETQTLRTTWAQQVFPLPQALMDKALDRERDRLLKAGTDPLVALAYLTVMPLVWEAPAIRRYVEAHGSHPALPLIETAREATTVAGRDYPMTQAQIRALYDLVREPPTA